MRTGRPNGVWELRAPERIIECIDTRPELGLRSRLISAAGELLHHRVLERDEVRALDEGVALSGEPGAVRIVLAGSGITSGWGVSTQGLALVGALQRSVQRRLGAPVDAVQASRIGARLADAVDVLSDHLDGSEDALVLAFGWSDVFALTSVQRWTETLIGVLDLLARDRTRCLPVVVVGLPPMDRLGITGLLGPVLRRHGERLNAATRAVVATRSEASFVALDAPVNRESRPWGSPEAYHEWSLPIADGLADALRGRLRSECDPLRGFALEHAFGGEDRVAEELYREAASIPLPRASRPTTSADRAPAAPSLLASRHGRVGTALDAVRMRTWIRRYAMQVLDDLGHPPLTDANGALHRTLVLGSNPMRVLLFGAGLAVGYGVRDRGDAVDGALAHALSGARRRGVVLENRAVQHLRLEEARASLGAVGTFSYDLAVWFPSFTDGLDRPRLAGWRRRLRAMIRELRTVDHVPLLLTHMPVPAGMHPAALIARPWVRRLNRVIDQVAAEWDDVLAAPTEPFFAADVGQKVTDRAYFKRVAAAVLPAAELLLDGSGSPARSRARVPSAHRAERRLRV